MHKIYNRHGYAIEEFLAKASLTLPLLRAPISSVPDPGIALFSVNNILNPTTLIRPTEEQLRQFASARNILNLHVCNPEDNETRFENQPTTREALRSDDDIDSGESKDDDDNDDGNGAESEGPGTEGARSDSVKTHG